MSQRKPSRWSKKFNNRKVEEKKKEDPNEIHPLRLMVIAPDSKDYNPRNYKPVDKGSGLLYYDNINSKSTVAANLVDCTNSPLELTSTPAKDVYIFPQLARNILLHKDKKTHKYRHNM